MKITFILGLDSSKIHGQFKASDMMLHRALTGSEAAMVLVGRALAGKGHDVTMMCDVVDGLGSQWYGLNVVPLGQARDDQDVYVSMNEAEHLRFVPRNGVRVLWMQICDFSLNVAKDWNEYVDVGVALSKIHFDHMLKVSGGRAVEEEWTFIGNPVDHDWIDSIAKQEGRTFQDPHKMIWCSSPDRGLHRLLEMYPRIRAAVPETTLDIYYRFDPWLESAREMGGPVGDRARYIAECLKRLGRQGENGVTVIGPVPQDEMIRRMLCAAVFPYTYEPVRFTESFCSAGIMADACGCTVLMPKLDALGEVFEDIAVWMPEKPGKNQDEWVNGIVRAMEYKGDRVLRPKNLSRFGIDEICEQWEALLVDACEAKGGPKEAVTVPSIDDELERMVRGGTATPRQIVSKKIAGIDRPLRVAVILGKLGASVHGEMDVENMFTSTFMTGTVQGFIGIAWGLAERGHVVDAFCDCKTNVINSKLGGVNFYRADSVTIDHTYDAYISVNEPDVLRAFPSKALRVCAMWLNDFSFCREGFDEHVDMYICPSVTHRRYMLRFTPISWAKSEVIHISTNLEFFTGCKKKPYSIAYCSSPDRGLHHLLKIFEMVLDRWEHMKKEAGVEGLGDPTLNIYYRFSPWYDNIISDPNLNDTPLKTMAEQIYKDITRLGSKGVRLVGPVPPASMARALSETHILAYPCDPVRFTEGYSVAVLDACAAGCVPVISGVDALPEVYANAAVIISGSPNGQYDQWVEMIVKNMWETGICDTNKARALSHASAHGRQQIAAHWEQMLIDRVARKGEQR
jgi:glycosyltransferase involved in cell wall biosynthesis